LKIVTFQSTLLHPNTALTQSGNQSKGLHTTCIYISELNPNIQQAELKVTTVNIALFSINLGMIPDLKEICDLLFNLKDD